MEFLMIIVLLVLSAFSILFFKKNQKLSETIHHLTLEQSQRLAKIEQDHLNQINQLRDDFNAEKEFATQKALLSSRNAIKGQMSEKFCPFNSNFNYRPADCSFLGKPIDFIVFHNIEHYREGAAKIEDVEIIFLEIKTGKSRLSIVEQAIQHAIEHKRVRFETYRFEELDHLPTTATTETVTASENIELVKTPVVESNKVTKEVNRLEPINFAENDLTYRTEAKNSVVLKNREMYPRSSYQWSSYEQDLLLKKYEEDYSLHELSTIFQRHPSGISSRLLRLGYIIENS